MYVQQHILIQQTFTRIINLLLQQREQPQGFEEAHLPGAVNEPVLPPRQEGSSSQPQEDQDSNAQVQTEAENIHDDGRLAAQDHVGNQGV
jgi:hypothetical protein